MKLFKGLALMGALCLVASSALRASDDDVLNRILAKYEMSKKSKTQSSMSGDLATQLRPDSKPLKAELQKTAQTGKKLQDQLDKSGLQELEKEINTQEDKKENVIKQMIQSKQSNPQENPKKRTKEEKQRINQERRAKINEHIKNAPPSVKHNWNNSSTYYNMENRTRIRELKKRQSIENKVMKRRNKAYLKHMR